VTLARRVTLGLWTGLLLSQGALFAPLLFVAIPDRFAAGRLAGLGFTIVGYASVAFGVLAVLLRARTVAGQRREALWALLPGALLVFSHVVLRPWMELARHSGANGAPGPEFGALHAAASVLYAIATLTVLVLWVRDERRAGA
jgi:hypothetical protein